MARLARTTGLSGSAIGRRARAEGFRIGNDLIRGLVNAQRGRSLTPGQQRAAEGFSVRLITNYPSPQQYGEALGEQFQQVLRRGLERTRLRISYRVTGTVGFRWDRSGSLDGEQATISTDQTVHIRGTKLDAFNANTDGLLEASIPSLLDSGARELSVNSNYGEAILIGEPRLEILNIQSNAIQVS